MEEFFAQNIRHFYSQGEYNRDVNIEYCFCDDLYETALEYSPCDSYTNNLTCNKRQLEINNGLCIPRYRIDDGVNVLIAKKTFEIDNYTVYGTFQHETTHAHDYILLADYLKVDNFAALLEHEDHLLGMRLISEFNARKNGFRYVRELAYGILEEEQEIEYINKVELPMVFERFGNISDEYDLAQFFGRMAVLDKFSECDVRDKAYKYLKEKQIFDTEQILIQYFEVFDILNSKKNDTRIVISVLEDVKRILCSVK